MSYKYGCILFVCSLIATEAATYKDSYSISGCKRIDKSVAYYAVGFQKSGHGTR